MTICNIYSFGYLDEKKESWLEFFDNVTAKNEEWPYDRMTSVLSDLTETEYYDIWANLLYPTSYISSMNIHDILRFLQTKSQPLIIDCYLSGTYYGNCINTTHFMWDPIYQGCYTIRVPENVTQVSIGQLSIKSYPKAVILVAL